MQSALFFFCPSLPLILKFLPSYIWGWCGNLLTLLAFSVLFAYDFFSVFSITKCFIFLLFSSLSYVLFIRILPLPVHTYASLSLSPPITHTWQPITLPSVRPLKAHRLGSLVSGLLSSKSRSSQICDSRQTPTSSVQSKSLCSGGDALFCSFLKCLKSCVPDVQIISLA